MYVHTHVCVHLSVFVHGDRSRAETQAFNMSYVRESGIERGWELISIFFILTEHHFLVKIRTSYFYN